MVWNLKERDHMEDLVTDVILGWVRGVYGRENKYIKRNDVAFKERYHMEDLVVDVMILIMR
jgi:hypothetical protein